MNKMIPQEISLLNKLIPLLILTLPILSAQAAEIPRPEFNEKRQFSLSQNQEAQNLSRVKIETFVFSKDLQTCNTSNQDIESLLVQTTSLDSAFTSAVRSLFPNFDITQLKSLRLLVDSFGSLTSAFRSFYIAPQTNMKATISLDCSQASRMSWPALLSHEAVHHLNHNRNISPWVDEMLAQVIEIRAAAAYPTPRFESLRSKALIPSFFAREKTFTSSQQYAVNMLFGLYLSQNFGGQNLFPLLTQNVQTLSDVAKQVRTFSEGKNQFDWIRPYISPRGLIRHFALALNVNLPMANNGSIYQAPGWTGFTAGSETQNSGKYYIEPGGSLRISKKYASLFADRDKNAAWDVYRILKKGMTFKIQSPEENVSGDWDQDYIVIINGSDIEYFEIGLP